MGLGWGGEGGSRSSLTALVPLPKDGAQRRLALTMYTPEELLKQRAERMDLAEREQLVRRCFACLTHAATHF